MSLAPSDASIPFIFLLFNRFAATVKVDNRLTVIFPIVKAVSGMSFTPGFNRVMLSTSSGAGR